MAAMTGLTAPRRELREHEKASLIKLATYTARARTAVEHDGYTKELLVIPQAEGTSPTRPRTATPLRRP